MAELVRVEKLAGSTHDIIDGVARSGGKTRVKNTNICPYIELGDLRWDEYLGRLSKRHHKNVNKRTRRLSRDFELEFSVASSGNELPMSMQEFIDLHNEHWQKAGGSAAFNSPGLVDFHIAFSRIAHANGWSRLCCLKLDGDIAAAIYQFSYKGTFYYYQSALNDHYSKYSVGMVALSLSIKLAIDEGVRTFEMLHDNEDYKYLWADAERPLVRLEIYPSSVESRLAMNMATTKGALQKMTSMLAGRV